MQFLICQHAQTIVNNFQNTTANPPAETAQPITSVVLVKNICHETQTGSGAHPASYSINARVKGGQSGKLVTFLKPML
jgi:hypothetical protein